MLKKIGKWVFSVGRVRVFVVDVVFEWKSSVLGSRDRFVLNLE